ncbi:hypothetical protein [Mesobacillus subterraneus]|uniref:Uncharacterized protein n=1 Tax=Mesobacillus subterraneus TaxID=285983 RepID=A0A0D6Z8S3_9BACI|nr:hypothetical protein [Mesobacillus subterraneus]KIY21947.1 hypothetical protein UB32_11120 [Mesobacillus subterraneus]
MIRLQKIKMIFIRAIRSPVLLILLSESIVLGLLYKYGFRITYGPDLEASWDAISAIGQWAGVFVGFLIPIAAVYLQSKLDKSREDIGESNTALLEEFESFKNEYEDKLKRLSSHFDGQGNLVIDGGKFEEHKKEKRSIEELKNEAHKFVNISMVTKTKRVADHLGITPEEAFDILEELLRHDGLISAGGIVRKDNMDTLVWTKKS